MTRIAYEGLTKHRVAGKSEAGSRMILLLILLLLLLIFLIVIFLLILIVLDRGAPGFSQSEE